MKSASVGTVKDPTLVACFGLESLALWLGSLRSLYPGILFYLLGFQVISYYCTVWNKGFELALASKRGPSFLRIPCCLALDPTN